MRTYSIWINDKDHTWDDWRMAFNTKYLGELNKYNMYMHTLTIL